MHEAPAPQRKVVEFRLHGRGGQGGVTCAKILAAVHAELGKSVQTFGDYAGERSGAPVRAYTRVSDEPIQDRNKVYNPDHLLVLDPTLLSDEVVAGLAPGGTLLVNSPRAPEEFGDRFAEFRLATVDATAIARRRGIGTRSVVIVNTTIAGAIVRALGLPLSALDQTYHHLGFQSNLEAAREAYESVKVREPLRAARPVDAAARPAELPRVIPLVEHREGPPPVIPTGSWRSQTPRYVEHLAPCNAWCPAGNDVIGFVQAAAKEGEAAAAEILGRTTPLSGVCGRVCPAPCMEGCNRREYDGAVQIRGLERWIADHVPVASKEAVPTTRPRRIAIVGGGPAGLAAAYTAARLGHLPTIFEGEDSLGGVLRTGIPSYRLPREVVDQEIGNILRLGVEVRCSEFLDRARIATLAREYDALIVATGLQKLRGLDVPGVKLEGVEQGVRFLHRVNVGGGGFLTGHVVVLGGGNTALDCARSALRRGAEHVTVAYRRTRDEMPAIAEEVEEAIEEGIEFVFLAAPVAFRGAKRVLEVELAECVLGDADASGRRSPVVTERTFRRRADAVLLALGQSADLGLLPRGWELRDGRIYPNCEPLPVFAAGDLATGDGTVAHAIGDGRRAVTRALRALGEDIEIFERPDRRRAVAATEIRFDHFERAEPAQGRHVPAQQRMRSFDEGSLGLADATDATRCFSCGHCTECDTCLVYCPEGMIRRGGAGDDAAYDVDVTNCKGCGICVAECPRKGMEMVPR